METLTYTNFSGFSGDSHKVGLSAPLSELTADDIINFDKFVCGAVNSYVNVEYIGKIPQISLPETANNKIMFSTDVSWSGTFWCKKPYEQKIYVRTILLSVPQSKTDRGYAFSKNDADVKIVTEISDYQDLFISTNIGKSYENPFEQKTGAGVVSTGKITNTYTNKLITGDYIIPVWVVTDGEHVWLRSGTIYNTYYCNFNNNATNQGFINGSNDFDNNSDYYLSWGFNPNTLSNPVLCTDLAVNDTPLQVENNGKTFGIMMSYGASNYQPRGTQWFNNNIDFNLTPYFENNPFIDINAFYGLYMRSIVKYEGNYVWYKPIIKNGIVIGYSTDLQAESEIDKWENLENHSVPFSPPSSGDDNDSETDMEIGSLYSASGMVRYYKVTSENLQMLSKLMSNVDVVGTKNLLPNLISLKAFPIDFDRLGRGTVKTIEIGGVEMTDSINGTAQGITVDSTYHFLTCCDTTIQGKYGDISSPHFLDFSPYTQVELILPLAGSIVLPDNAMYKSLNVTYVYDIVNGSAICVIKSNGTVISTIPCTLSQDVPFSAINVGSKTSAMISNITNVAQNLATLGVSVGTGNLVGGISSGIGTVGSIAQTVMSNNQNYIEKFGRTGDMCDFGLVKKAYIKYTRPVDIIPENFGRTNGYLCNVTKKLSDCSGFTMCENPEINCPGTENEKNEIKRLLESGVII